MDLLISHKTQNTRGYMETKTKIILLKYYKDMYERMKNSVLKQRIGRLIRELEEEKGADTRSTDE